MHNMKIKTSIKIPHREGSMPLNAGWYFGVSRGSSTSVNTLFSDRSARWGDEDVEPLGSWQ